MVKEMREGGRKEPMEKAASRLVPGESMIEEWTKTESGNLAISKSLFWGGEGGRCFA